jgi:malonyl-CoA O-methyltransferase
VGAKDGPAAPAALREPLNMAVRLSPVEAYAKWAPAWESDLSPIVALESRWLAPWLEDLRGKVFVDLSCGVGRWLAYARARGASVFGTDLCREMLLEARKKEGLRSRIALADTRALPLVTGCAGVALCALSLGHMAPVESGVAELARIVRPGGTLIVTDFHPDALRRGWKRTFQSDGESYEVETHAYTPDQLIDCAARHGLALRELLEPCFDEPERALFRRAGRPDLFEQTRHIPAVLLARWTRP